MAFSKKIIIRDILLSASASYCFLMIHLHLHWFIYYKSWFIDRITCLRPDYRRRTAWVHTRKSLLWWCFIRFLACSSGQGGALPFSQVEDAAVFWELHSNAVYNDDVVAKRVVLGPASYKDRRKLPPKYRRVACNTVGQVSSFYEVLNSSNTSSRFSARTHLTFLLSRKRGLWAYCDLCDYLGL
jgi:hypothetical protein